MTSTRSLLRLAPQGEPNATAPTPTISANSKRPKTTTDHIPQTPYTRSIPGIGLFLGLSLLILPACVPAATQSLPLQAAPDPTALEAGGAWKHLDAAVSAATSRHEMAVLTRTSPDHTSRRYTLLTVDNRPGHLEATREPDGAIRLVATIGRFGDPAGEDALLRSIAHRLAQLEGPGFAPIRW